MEYVQEAIERAMLLNLNDVYLDSTQCLYIMDKHVYFYLDNYVQVTDETCIEIPEGVHYVFMFNDIKVYGGKSYVISFPESLLSVGRVTVTDHYINLAMKDVVNKNDFQCLSNIVLDFRRCNNIISIWQRCFSNLKLKELYFSNTVTEFYHCSFQRCSIDRLYAPGVSKIGGESFNLAQINEIELGKLEVFYKDSFVDAVFNHGEIVISDKSAFKFMNYLPDVETVYMPYDLNAGKDNLRDALTEVLSNINKSSLKDLLADIHDIDNKLQKYSNCLLDRISDLYEYLHIYFYTEDNYKNLNNLKRKIILCCMDFYNKNLISEDRVMYLYKPGESDVHSREYEWFFSFVGLRLFIER